MKRLLRDKVPKPFFKVLVVILVKRSVSFIYTAQLFSDTCIFREAYVYFCQNKVHKLIFSLRKAKTKHTQAQRSTWTHTDTHQTDFVKAQPLASQNPVFMPMFGGEYAADPLLCFPPQSLSYLKVHCCHKAESKEKHGRAWWLSINQSTGSKLLPPQK